MNSRIDKTNKIEKMFLDAINKNMVDHMAQKYRKHKTKHAMQEKMKEQQRISILN